MAEFCLECMNKYAENEKEKLKEKDVIVDWDLCEGCGGWKPCVITIKKKGIFTRLKYMIRLYFQ